jgi:hypothetical protein
MSCFLDYSFSVTGDCSNTSSGAFEIEIFGDAPDYSIQWISPSLGTVVLGPGVTGYTQTSLSAGTYSFNIIDSCSPINTVLPVNINISSGTCITISGVENTLCGSDNGSLTAITTNFYGTSEFSLYNSLDELISSASSFDNEFVFDTLSADTYYVVGNDGGGCTGRSETVIVQTSTTVDYGFYVVNDAGCSVNSGKIFITGITGNPPYSYLWSNSQTTQSISGLTQGTYGVTVTDNSGCAISKSAVVLEVPKVGFGAFTSVNPSCVSSDGEITITLTGGTAPYYYSGSNGSTIISFATSVTFTNLPSGIFSVEVTDAALCKFVTSTSLSPAGGFSVASITKNNATCGSNSGSIDPIILFGGSSPYIFQLTKPDGGIISNTVNTNTWQFTNLTEGVYTLTISDQGPCVFTEQYTIENLNIFDFNISLTGTTCGLQNGSVSFELSGQTTPPYTYEINGKSVTNSLTANTFTNLTYGNYTAVITDNTGCSQIKDFTIPSSLNVDFVLFGTNATTGSDGQIDVFITNGEPPFTLEWSPNVNGQTGTTVTNLSGGTYSLKITDNNGCVRQRSVEITGFDLISNRQSYNVCNSNFTNNNVLIKKGIREMLVEGFFDLTSGDTNCILTNSTFEALVTIGGVSSSSEFFTGSTLNDFPGDNLWVSTITSLLLGFEGINNVETDLTNNTIKIITECDYDGGSDVIINLVITYDIACEVCGITPTPTKTPTPTPTTTSSVIVTPTVTSTNTPTVTPTRTPTPTPTSTPGVTPTPTSTPGVTPTPTPTSAPGITPVPSSTPLPSGCVCGIMSPNVFAGCTQGIPYDVTYYKCGEDVPTVESFECTVVAALCVNQSQPDPTADLGLATWIPSGESCETNSDCSGGGQQQE